MADSVLKFPNQKSLQKCVALLKLFYIHFKTSSAETLSNAVSSPFWNDWLSLLKKANATPAMKLPSGLDPQRLPMELSYSTTSKLLKLEHRPQKQPILSFVSSPPPISVVFNTTSNKMYCYMDSVILLWNGKASLELRSNVANLIFFSMIHFFFYSLPFVLNGGLSDAVTVTPRLLGLGNELTFPPDFKKYVINSIVSLQHFKQFPDPSVQGTLLDLMEYLEPAKTALSSHKEFYELISSKEPWFLFATTTVEQQMVVLEYFLASLFESLFFSSDSSSLSVDVTTGAVSLRFVDPKAAKTTQQSHKPSSTQTNPQKPSVPSSKKQLRGAEKPNVKHRQIEEPLQIQENIDPLPMIKRQDSLLQSLLDTDYVRSNSTPRAFDLYSFVLGDEGPAFDFISSMIAAPIVLKKDSYVCVPFLLTALDRSYIAKLQLGPLQRSLAEQVTIGLSDDKRKYELALAPFNQEDLPDYIVLGIGSKKSTTDTLEIALGVADSPGTDTDAGMSPPDRGSRTSIDIEYHTCLVIHKYTGQRSYIFTFKFTKPSLLTTYQWQTLKEVVLRRADELRVDIANLLLRTSLFNKPISLIDAERSVSRVIQT